MMANAYASNCFLPNELADFAAEYPSIRVSIEEHSSPEIIRALQAGVAEIGIASMESFPEEIATFLYGIEHLAVITPRGHPLASTECFTLDTVLAEPFVCLPAGSEIHTLTMNLAVAHGATLDIRIQVQSFDAVCRMVAAGMGIGLVPHDWVLLNTTQEGFELEVLPVAEEWAEQPVYICHHRDRPMTVAAEALLEHLISGSFPRKCGVCAAGFVP
jgi:DNA-binding transcriptional LysR family regulator